MYQYLVVELSPHTSSKKNRLFGRHFGTTAWIGRHTEQRKNAVSALSVAIGKYGNLHNTP
jgi:hypothetical protein